MKLKIAIISILTAVFANGASIDYLSNNSTSYFQNPSQAGKISVEGVFYNPAGTAFVDDGTYVNLNKNLLLYKFFSLRKYKNSFIIKIILLTFHITRVILCYT